MRYRLIQNKKTLTLEKFKTPWVRNYKSFKLKSLEPKIKGDFFHVKGLPSEIKKVFHDEETATAVRNIVLSTLKKKEDTHEIEVVIIKDFNHITETTSGKGIDAAILSKKIKKEKGR